MALALMLGVSLVSGGSAGYLPLDTAISTLHIGNSRTYEENLPAILAQFLTEEGYTSPYCTSYAIGGATLVDHAADVDCATAIDDRVWTHAFLQGATYDMMPANRAANIAAAVTLAGLILTKAPDCEVILYQITALADGHADVDGAPYASPDAMAEENRLGYLEMQAELRAEFPGKRFPIVRHGECIQADGGLYPSTNPDYRDFYDVDLLHPTEDSQFENGAQESVVVTNGRNPIPHAAAVATWMDVSQSNPIAGDATRMATHAYHFQRYGTYLPNFSTHPTNASAVDGAASFTVVARGGGTLQWFRDAVAISGATSATLNLTGLDEDDNGAEFFCRATNSRGSHDSATATLTVVTFVELNIDFDHIRSGANDGWSRVSSSDANLTTIAGVRQDLWDINGSLAPQGLTVVAPATGAGTNNNGVGGGLGTAGDITQTHWICNTNAFEFDIDTLPAVALLHEATGYRENGVSIRTTKLTGTGTDTANVTWDAGDTPVAWSQITVTPLAGVIRYRVELGAGNNVNFGYIGAMKIRIPA